MPAFLLSHDLAPPPILPANYIADLYLKNRAQREERLKERGAVLLCQPDLSTEAESKEKHGVWGPIIYAVVDCKLTLCRRQNRLQHIYQGQPYARVELNSMPESTLSPIWPQ